MEMIKVEAITNQSDFYNMGKEWDTLLDNSRSKSVYLTWEWLYTWWEIFGKDRELLILVARKEGELVGFAPFVVRKFQYFGIIPFRRLEFLGMGENETDEVCSNYLDLVAREGSKDIYDAFLEYICDGLKSGEWDEVCLNTIPESSVILDSLSRYFGSIQKRDGLFFDISNSSYCAIINLPQKWEDYLKYLSKKYRDRIKKGRKQLADKGAVKLESIEDFDRIDSAFKEFVALHQKRWNSIGKSGLFVSKKFMDFHEKVLKLFLKNKWARISLLKSDGRVIAGSYRLFYDSTVYSYLTAYDPDFKSKIGIGLIKRSYDIEDAISKGYKIYDFYKAKEGSYKFHLAKEKRGILNIRIAKDCIRERFLKTAVFLKREIKKPIKKQSI